MPLNKASSFGIIEADIEGRRIRGFIEKTENSPPIRLDPSHSYGSMGNYLFETDGLLTVLNEAKERGENDPGRHILPRLIHSHRIFAYKTLLITVFRESLTMRSILTGVTLVTLIHFMPLIMM